MEVMVTKEIIISSYGCDGFNRKRLTFLMYVMITTETVKFSGHNILCVLWQRQDRMSFLVGVMVTIETVLSD